MAHQGWGPDWAGVDVPERSLVRERARARARRHRRRRRVRWIVRWLVVAAVLLGATAVAAGVWLALEARRAHDELGAAATVVSDLQEAGLDADEGEIDRQVARLQSLADSAYSHTHGVPWSVASQLPWVGDDVRAVRTLSSVVRDLASDALPALAQARSAVDPDRLAPVDGAVDLSPLAEVAPAVVTADQAVADAAREIGAIDTGRILGPVARPVTEMRDKLGDIRSLTATAARAVQLIPPMLGGDGPRTYLLLVQNNAEARATGGIPGAVLVLTAEDGRVEVVGQEAGNAIRTDQPALDLTDDEKNVFGDNLGRLMLDVTFTPDFPRAAALAAAIWRERTGEQVDGVASVDPVALSLLLRATGPVALPTGESLDADNATALLLSEVYERYRDPSAQDAFFATAASAAFAAVTHGGTDASGAIDALAEAARQGRLLVWSRHPDEQGRLTGTVLGGDLEGERDGAPVVGLYVNDAGSDKKDYYLDYRADLAGRTCRPDGSQALSLTATVRNTIEGDGSELPSYVAGLGGEPGLIRTEVMIYAPAGGYVDAVTVDGRPQSVAAFVHDGLSMVKFVLNSPPGEVSTIRSEIISGPGQSELPRLRITPGVRAQSAPRTTSACAIAPVP